ncbi:hypothetical protein PC128_g18344 [Phytophthora cactorum]|nr:hypothetical protein PC128_g18344 [Phytophthora cactorum]
MEQSSSQTPSQEHGFSETVVPSTDSAPTAAATVSTAA